MSDKSDKEKEKTDEEWAQLVADKIAERDARDKAQAASSAPEAPERTIEVPLSPADQAAEKGVKVTAGEPTIQERVPADKVYKPHDAPLTELVPAKSVTVKPGQASIDFRDEGKGAGEQPTNPDGSKDREYAQAILDHQSADAGRAVLSGAVKSAAPAREGSVYLQNTSADGSKERGQVVHRAMFKDDAEFDRFVQDARSKGNLYDEAAQKDTADGNTIGNTVRKLFSGAAKGGPAPAMNTDKPVQEPAPGSKYSPYAKDEAALSSESTKGSGGGGGGSDGASQGAGGDGMRTVEVPLSGADQLAEKGSQMRAPLYQNAGMDRGSSGAGGGDAGAGGATPYPAAGDQSLPMSNGGNNILSVPGYVAGQVLKGTPWGEPMQAPAPGGQAAPPLPAGVPAPPRVQAGQAPAVPMEPFSDQGMANFAATKMEATHHAARIIADQQAAEYGVRQNEQDLQDKAAKQYQDKMQYVEAGQQALQKSMAEAMEVLNNPAKTPDPERYWRNHSRIMFAIGVGLLAQAGKDINGVLSNVNSAIDRDVEQQKAEFEAPRNAAKAKLAGAQSMYALFREQGHDAFEAQKMAAIVLKDRATTEIAKVAANSNAQMAGPNSQMAIADIGAKMAMDVQALQQHRQMTDTANYVAQGNRQHQMNEDANAENKLNADGKALADTEARKLSDSVTGLQELTDAGKVFGSGLGSAIYNKLASLDPTAKSEAANFNVSRPLYTRILMSLLSPAERQNESMVKNVSNMVPFAGDLDGPARWEKMLDFVGSRVGGEAAALRRKGTASKIDQITGRGAAGGTHQETTADGRTITVAN